MEFADHMKPIIKQEIVVKWSCNFSMKEIDINKFMFV